MGSMGVTFVEEEKIDVCVGGEKIDDQEMKNFRAGGEKDLSALLYSAL